MVNEDPPVSLCKRTCPFSVFFPLHGQGLSQEPHTSDDGERLSQNPLQVLLLCVGKTAIMYAKSVQREDCTSVCVCVHPDSKLRVFGKDHLATSSLILQMQGFPQRLITQLLSFPQGVHRHFLFPAGEAQGAQACLGYLCQRSYSKTGGGGLINHLYLQVFRMAARLSREPGRSSITICPFAVAEADDAFTPYLRVCVCVCVRMNWWICDVLALRDDRVFCFTHRTVCFGRPQSSHFAKQDHAPLN